MRPDGRVTFIGHDSVGAEMVAEICARLRASDRLRQFLAGLTRNHLVLGFLVHERPLDRRTVYRYLERCEPVEVEVTLLSCADRLATRGKNADAAIAAHLELARELMAEALAWRRDGAAGVAAARRRARQGARHRAGPRARGAAGSAARGALRRRGDHRRGGAGAGPAVTLERVNEDCVFCQILAGNMPGEIVYEDEHSVAFMDIFPWTRGHAVVVPRTHSKNLYEIPDEDLANTMAAASGWPSGCGTGSAAPG